MVSLLGKIACVACLGGAIYNAPLIVEETMFWGWERTERKIAKRELKEAKELERLKVWLQTIRKDQSKA